MGFLLMKFVALNSTPLFTTRKTLTAFQFTIFVKTEWVQVYTLDIYKFGQGIKQINGPPIFKSFISIFKINRKLDARVPLIPISKFPTALWANPEWFRSVHKRFIYGVLSSRRASCNHNDL